MKYAARICRWDSIRSSATVILFITSSFYCAAQSDTAKHRQVIKQFLEKQASVRYVYQTSLSPDGKWIAWSADGEKGPEIHRASLANPDKTLRITASPATDGHAQNTPAKTLNNKPSNANALNKQDTSAKTLNKKPTANPAQAISANETPNENTSQSGPANETEPQWSPDGKYIAFLSDGQTPGQNQAFIANATTGELINKRPLTQFDGYVSHLKWSPNGRYLSVLYVEKASREPSPMAAENKATGLIDSMVNRDIQRIAVVNAATGETQQATPRGLYIFEYDWSPDSKKFAYTAALPPGDDNWYIARLYAQPVSSPDSVLIYTPAQQIAVPRWSPDGTHIAFIEGLMSDQGGTGGEIFSVDANKISAARNLTPQRSSTPSWFTWTPDGNMIFSEFKGGSIAINKLNTTTKTVQLLSSADESMRAGNEEMSMSVAVSKPATVFGFIRTSWTMYPEVWAGDLKKPIQITHLNTSMEKPLLKPENISWRNDDQPVQGWLLPPANYDPSKKYPMLVCVHGGPAWISTPTWSAPDFNSTVYPQLGYFVFFPNPRGSYGQGENFTLANRRDWGFGDLRDILSGVDAIVKKYSVDSARIGVYGWSYGGASSMFAVTQTHTFKAAVAGAGAADWCSYYGQNAIDKWMKFYFGASPYDDPEAYRKCSAMTYIKNAKTPTLVLVGERDGEAPPPQSLQFWHALKELHVPTQLMIYADEGHSFNKFENMIDVCLRTFEWFNTHLQPAAQ